MLLALGAASTAIDALQSLTSSKGSSPQKTGFRQTSTSPFDLASSSVPGSSAPAPVPGGFSQLSPATMTALLAAQAQSGAPGTSAPTSRSVALNQLFSRLDTEADGKIAKSEFEAALGAGGSNVANADDVFSKLDTNGDGSISLQELASALKGGKGRQHHHAGAADASSDISQSDSSDQLLQALSGASSTSVTNGDGSITTSVTYADGSKVTMTSPAAKTASGSATSSYNFIEQMIAREAQAISSTASVPLSLNV
jgi:Ca2+-binding EF-hand superfamily protein